MANKVVLKPCPFCGSKPRLIVQRAPDWPGVGAESVLGCYSRRCPVSPIANVQVYISGTKPLTACNHKEDHERFQARMKKGAVAYNKAAKRATAIVIRRWNKRRSK